ncbi:MAG TPA: hypothetical protein PLQ19_02870 [Aeromicrobium sp.]|nr:hypothetical protein [Aeromicrobium sp.]
MLIRPPKVLNAAVKQARRLLSVVGRSGGETPQPFAATGQVDSLGPEVLARFEARLDRLSPAERQRLDPTNHPRSFRQPDEVSCGATCLVVARAINDPPYALWLTTGYDARTNSTDPAESAERITAEIGRMHKQITSVRDHDGDPQVPWLRLIGTAPWAAARQMYGATGASGTPGISYRAHTIDPSELESEFDLIVAAVKTGQVLPLYVGSQLRPGHVVLITAVIDDQTLQVFEPAAGTMKRVTKVSFAESNLALAGWNTAWFVILPRT